ncbi:HD-GYP domain-containing protein [Roseomonas chloroacetimidivorans]|jgi:putative two-component system response regulator|uniref:HD-GYP domain-containing protein n=1 Tax=Roseomonas chloroacetimidivorans TaxID=1766656 RepID=UPI003C70F806
MLSENARSARDCLTAVERLRSVRLVEHEKRVGRLCHRVAGLMGFDDGHRERLALAASLHDIGKLAIPDAILEKRGPLDAAERQAMQQHSAFGAEILGQISDPVALLAAEVALRHHERWDGSGYPDGLAREAISREARIVGLCDVYDAIREERPYKPPISHEEAMRLILVGDPGGPTMPGKFDPELLAMLSRHEAVFRAAFAEGG